MVLPHSHLGKHISKLHNVWVLQLLHAFNLTDDIVWNAIPCCISNEDALQGNHLPSFHNSSKGDLSIQHTVITQSIALWAHKSEGRSRRATRL